MFWSDYNVWCDSLHWTHLSHDGDATRIPTELLDVLHHPLQCCHLVHQPIVCDVALGHWAGVGIEEAEYADSVVEGDNDDLA